MGDQQGDDIRCVFPKSLVHDAQQSLNAQDLTRCID